MDHAAQSAGPNPEWLAEFKENLNNQLGNIRRDVERAARAAESADAKVGNLTVHHARLAAQIYEVTGNGTNKGRLAELEEFVSNELEKHDQLDTERFEEIRGLIERRRWSWRKVARVTTYVTSIAGGLAALVGCITWAIKHADVIAQLLRN